MDFLERYSILIKFINYIFTKKSITTILKNIITSSILVLGLLIVSANNKAVAQLGKNSYIKLQSFKTQEFDPKTKQLVWRLEGSEAILKGSKVLLKKAKVTFFDKEGNISTVINSNNSTFDKVKKIWESDEKVHIIDRQMTTTGKGFKLYVQKGKRKLFIKRDVKVKLRLKKPEKQKSVTE